VDHVATLRQARKGSYPDPIAAALAAEQAGGDGVTVHLRGDRRHIQERDVALLIQVCATPINLEMAATDEMLTIACRLRPHSVTLVPEKVGELTTEGGLDVVLQSAALERILSRLREHGIHTSLFVDPDPDQIKASRKCGSEWVELNTNAYATAREENQGATLTHIQTAARLAQKLGLRVLAGHALTERNVAPVSEVPEIVELNIGHSIIARALLVGMERAVQGMLAKMA